MNKVVCVDGVICRTKLLNGVEILAKSVKCTLGPKGRNAIVNSFGKPIITNDGVTIAKEIELKDEIENAGVEILRSACVKSNEIAGDGSTTTTVLAESIFKNGLKYLNDGANPIMLRSGINYASEIVKKYLNKIAVTVDDNNAIKQVATISSGNEEIGNIIAKAYVEVGKDGAITIEEGNSTETLLCVQDGLKINKGYISPYMCTNEQKMQAELNNPYILVTDKKITKINDLLPIVDMVAKENGSLFIIAEDVDGDALTTLVINNMRKVFNCVSIRAPYYGEKRKSNLSDIALCVGAKFITNDLSDNFSNVKLKDLGVAEKIIVNKDETTIIGAKGNREEILARVEILKSQMQNELDEIKHQDLKERIGQLNGGVAVIKVGAISDIEMKEKKLRIEDALNATEAAIEEGYVPGGGIALLKAKSEVLNNIDNLKGDELIGAKLLTEALDSLTRQIAINSAVDDEEVINNILSVDQVNYGYDALNNRYGDMVEFGIIDPKKVTRSALECACSVASTLLTTECVAINGKINEYEVK